MNENYLNEIEKSKVISFCNDKQMFEAVRKCVLYTIYHQGTLVASEEAEGRNWVFSVDGPGKSDEQIGQEVRSSLAGLAYLKSGFDKLKEVRVVEKKEKKGNPAV